jgi:iron complex transport system substrate-binding protein
MNTDEHGLKLQAWCVAAVTLFCVAPGTTLSAAVQSERTVIDQTGRTVRVPTRVERVVSLAPNVTEILFALGVEDRLVGVTHQCNFPPAAAAKPKVGDTLNPSLETLILLQPDLVIGTAEGNRRETIDLLDRAGIPLYGTHARSVPEIFDSIRRIAGLLDVPQAGENLAAELEARLGRLEQLLAGARRPRVLVAIWLDPLITAGGDTFLNDVLRRAGADSVTASLSESWPRLSIEAVIESDPDYLVLPRLHSLQARLDDLRARPAWRHVRAVEAGRIVWLDEALLRPGPRIVPAIEDLARALHPGLFSGPEAARQ